MFCKCCNFLAEGIEFRYNAIALCNRVGHKGGGDIVVDYYDDKNPKAFKFDIEKYIEKRNNIIFMNQTGNVYPSCEECMELRRPVIKNINNLKILNIVLHHWTKCNSNCRYCYTNKDKNYFNKRLNYKVLPILQELAKKNYIDYDGIVNYAGGEISCLDEFEQLSKFFDSYDYFSVFNSSGIKFENTIANHLKTNKGLLIISLDSGRKDTHKYIKQVDTYDIVWKNLAKYSEYSINKELIYAKFIVLPNINDNEDEVYAFLKKVKSIHIEFVLFDLDIYYFNENRNNIPKSVTDIFYFALKKSEELGLKFLLYSNASVLFTRGEWKDNLWQNYIYDEASKDNVFKKDEVLILSKYNNIKKVSSVKMASLITNIPYPLVKQCCENYKKNKIKYIKTYSFMYAKDYLK